MVKHEVVAAQRLPWPSPPSKPNPFHRSKPTSLLCVIALCALLSVGCLRYLLRPSTSPIKPPPSLQSPSPPRVLLVEETNCTNALAGDDLTFVFVAGIKGVGHHLVNKLLKRSPNMNRPFTSPDPIKLPPLLPSLLPPWVLSVEETKRADALARDGPTFVFVVGVKGTGHHLVNKFLKRSLNMKRMRELGIWSSSKDEKASELFRLSLAMFQMRGGLVGFPSKFGNVQDNYNEVVEIMRTMRRKFVLRKGGGG